MTLSNVRSLVLWHLFIAGVALIAIWTYYQTLDPQTVGTLASSSADTQQAAAQTWIDHQRSFFGHYWNAATDWRNKVYDGITTPR